MWLSRRAGVQSLFLHFLFFSNSNSETSWISEQFWADLLRSDGWQKSTAETHLRPLDSFFSLPPRLEMHPEPWFSFIFFPFPYFHHRRARDMSQVPGFLFYWAPFFFFLPILPELLHLLIMFFHALLTEARCVSCLLYYFLLHRSLRQISNSCFFIF